MPNNPLRINKRQNNGRRIQANLINFMFYVFNAIHSTLDCINFRLKILGFSCKIIKKNINTLHEQINFSRKFVTKLCWCHIVGKIVFYTRAKMKCNIFSLGSPEAAGLSMRENIEFIDHFFCFET